MNKDFHFYGTYAAARTAGYNQNESKIIAWAAEMVDEFTKEFISDNKLNIANACLTCETLKDNAADEFKWLSDDKNETLGQIRRIWVPFHFLPGNIDMNNSKQGKPKPLIGYTGDRTAMNSKYNDVRDNKDFCMMCLHDGPLVEKMVNDTKDSPETGADADIKNLILIGIRMHVLADTWAHEYFAGTPNYWVNDATNVKVTKGTYNRTDRIGMTNPSCYSVVYLGHAEAGHYPDLGHLCYEYTTKWSNETIKINNPVRFKSALMEMIAKMKVINGRNVSTALDINDNTEMVSYEGTFEEMNTSENLKLFNSMAERHRNFVISELNNVGITI